MDQKLFLKRVSIVTNPQNLGYCHALHHYICKSIRC